MPSSMTFGGTYLGGASYGVKVLRGPLELLPEPRLDVQDTGRDGAVSQGSYYKARYFAVNGIIIGTSYDDLYSKLDAVTAILDPTLGNQLLVLDQHRMLGASRKRGIYCRMTGGIQGFHTGPNAFEFQITFVADYPFWVTEDAQGQTATAISATPTTVYEPTGASDVVSGNRAARPVYTITNTNASSIASVTLASVTRSQTMAVTVSLAQNNQLRIDCERMHVEKSTDAGATWASAMTGVTSAQVFPLLTAGVRNQLTVTGVTTGTITIAYRGEFL